MGPGDQAWGLGLGTTGQGDRARDGVHPTRVMASFQATCSWKLRSYGPLLLVLCLVLQLQLAAQAGVPANTLGE